MKGVLLHVATLLGGLRVVVFTVLWGPLKCFCGQCGSYCLILSLLKSFECFELFNYER